jgi:hypothetical protein
MSEDYTPSMDDIAEYYTACKMWGYDEVQGGEPYAIVRARYKEGFNHVIAAHDAELREQIAQEIEEADCHETCGSLYRKGIERAAEIARGKPETVTVTASIEIKGSPSAEQIQSTFDSVSGIMSEFGSETQWHSPRLQCDSCGREDSLSMDHIAESIAELEKIGWLREQDIPRDLCPDCAREKES